MHKYKCRFLHTKKQVKNPLGLINVLHDSIIIQDTPVGVQEENLVKREKALMLHCRLSAYTPLNTDRHTLENPLHASVTIQMPSWIP